MTFLSAFATLYYATTNNVFSLVPCPKIERTVRSSLQANQTVGHIKILSLDCFPTERLALATCYIIVNPKRVKDKKKNN